MNVIYFNLIWTYLQVNDIIRILNDTNMEEMNYLWMGIYILHCVMMSNMCMKELVRW